MSKRHSSAFSDEKLKKFYKAYIINEVKPTHHTHKLAPVTVIKCKLKSYIKGVKLNYQVLQTQQKLRQRINEKS